MFFCREIAISDVQTNEAKTMDRVIQSLVNAEPTLMNKLYMVWTRSLCENYKHLVSVQSLPHLSMYTQADTFGVQAF